MTASAWDVAGAVVWTVLAFGAWNAYFKYGARETAVWGTFQVLISAVYTAPAIYCIARLCGAHA